MRRHHDVDGVVAPSGVTRNPEVAEVPGTKEICQHSFGRPTLDLGESQNGVTNAPRVVGRGDVQQNENLVELPLRLVEHVKPSGLAGRQAPAACDNMVPECLWAHSLKEVLWKTSVCHRSRSPFAAFRAIILNRKHGATASLRDSILRLLHPARDWPAISYSQTLPVSAGSQTSPPQHLRAPRSARARPAPSALRLSSWLGTPHERSRINNHNSSLLSELLHNYIIRGDEIVASTLHCAGDVECIFTVKPQRAERFGIFQQGWCLGNIDGGSPFPRTDRRAPLLKGIRRILVV